MLIGDMGGDSRFWTLFGGIWLLVGIGFLGVSLGMPVFFDPDQVDPDSLPPWAFALFGFGFTGVGGAIIYRTQKAARRDRRLKDQGIDAKATVTDVRRSLVEINRQSRWNVCYRYEHGGQVFEGKSRALQAFEVQGFKPGDQVSIKLDPENPRQNLFLGGG